MLKTRIWKTKYWQWRDIDKETTEGINSPKIWIRHRSGIETSVLEWDVSALLCFLQQALFYSIPMRDIFEPLRSCERGFWHKLKEKSLKLYWDKYWERVGCKYFWLCSHQLAPTWGARHSLTHLLCKAQKCKLIMQHTGSGIEMQRYAMHHK